MTRNIENQSFMIQSEILESDLLPTVLAKENYRLHPDNQPHILDLENFLGIHYCEEIDMFLVLGVGSGQFFTYEDALEFVLITIREYEELSKET